MRPIADLEAATAKAVRLLLTDIDDTLTTKGVLPAAAYAALERLHEHGLLVVPTTGRPAGWCDMIARFWPVDAVVGENGAFFFRYDRRRKVMKRRFFASAEERAANRNKLEAILQKVLQDIPGAAVAADQSFRVADLAIDFREDVAELPQSDIDRIVRIFNDAGAQAKVSSIHVNGWFGHYDKLTMTRILAREEFAIDLDAERGRAVFIGDSPNDEPMFRFFPLSVGVANIRDALDRLQVLPAFITVARDADGFVEFADLLLQRRTESGPSLHVAK
jgi:HAD superfamily hydrolase (TIGR01484 family)